MDVNEVVWRLEGVDAAAVVEATALAIRLIQSPPEGAESVALQPRLEAAMVTINKQVSETKRLVSRLERLAAQAGRGTTVGF